MASRSIDIDDVNVEVRSERELEEVAKVLVTEILKNEGLDDVSVDLSWNGVEGCVSDYHCYVDFDVTFYRDDDIIGGGVLHVRYSPDTDGSIFVFSATLISPGLENTKRQARRLAPA